MGNNIKNEFAGFIAGTNAVKFGDFVLKSGKKSNTFFNFGEIFNGRELIELGRYFADFIVNNSLQNTDALFGPAYKGINLVIATSIALHQKYGVSIPFVYNRKVEKKHAEGGIFVGHDLASSKTVLILDDVITDGGTKLEALNMLSPFPDLVIKAIIVGVDRQETDSSGRACISVLREAADTDVFALTTKDEVLKFKKS